MTLVFQEHQPVEKWVNLLVWAAIGMYTIVLLGAMLILHPPLFFLILTLFSVPTLIFTAYNFRTLNIKIQHEHVSFGFGIFRKNIRWEEIAKVTLQPYLFTRFMGWGICLDLRGTIGFIARRSMGVQLHLKNGRKYFFSTSHPYELAEIITSHCKRQAGESKA